MLCKETVYFYNPALQTILHYCISLCFNLQACTALCCVHLIHITSAQEQRLTTHTQPLTLLMHKWENKVSLAHSKRKLLQPKSYTIKNLGQFYLMRLLRLDARSFCHWLNIRLAVFFYGRNCKDHKSVCVMINPVSRVTVVSVVRVYTNQRP